MLIFFSLKTFNSNAKQEVTIIQDAEIEFFLQKLINNFTLNENNQKILIKPVVVLDDSINAFVTGNNKIYINSGLLQNIDSFEELEGIIAHELGHLILGHVESRKIMLQRTSKLTGFSIIALIGLSLSGSNKNVDGIILAGNDFYYKKKFRYNRTQELEADIFSIKALNRLEISSKGLINFFNKIDKRNKLYSRKNNYYNSHPIPENRLELINSLSNFKHSKLKTLIVNKKLQLDLQKLKIKLIAYTKNKIDLNLIENVTKRENLTFFSAIKYFIQSDIKNSIDEMIILEKQSDKNPFTNEMLGNLYFLSGHYKKAINHYEVSINKFNMHNIPPPSIIKMSLAHTLSKLDNVSSLEKAISILEELIPSKSKSLILWRLVGTISNKLNMKSESLVALAEEKMLKKNYKKAKLLALKALKNDKIKSLYKIRALDIINFN